MAIEWNQLQALKQTILQTIAQWRYEPERPGGPFEAWRETDHVAQATDDTPWKIIEAFAKTGHRRLATSAADLEEDRLIECVRDPFKLCPTACRLTRKGKRLMEGRLSPAPHKPPPSATPPKKHESGPKKSKKAEMCAKAKMLEEEVALLRDKDTGETLTHLLGRFGVTWKLLKRSKHFVIAWGAIEELKAKRKRTREKDRQQREPWSAPPVGSTDRLSPEADKLKQKIRDWNEHRGGPLEVPEVTAMMEWMKLPRDTIEQLMDEIRQQGGQPPAKKIQRKPLRARS